MNDNSLDRKLSQAVRSLVALSFLMPGILVLVLGIAAIALPLFSPLKLATLLAWIFIISGIVKIIYGVQSRQARGFQLKLLEGILDLLLGILLRTNIWVGIIALRLLVGIFLVIAGVLEVIRAFKLRPASNWGWLLFSGTLKIIIGIIIWSKWPSNAEWLVGLFVGIILLVSGLLLIKFGVSTIKLTSEDA